MSDLFEEDDVFISTHPKTIVIGRCDKQDGACKALLVLSHEQARNLAESLPGVFQKIDDLVIQTGPVRKISLVD